MFAVIPPNEVMKYLQQKYAMVAEYFEHYIKLSLFASWSLTARLFDIGPY